MGFRVEENIESSVINSHNAEMAEIPKSPTPTTRSVGEVSDEGSDDGQDNDIMEFVMLMEISESSAAMKGLLLKILNSNKADQLKPFLKDRSADRQRRPKNKSGRRSSIGNGSSHHSKNGTKKSSKKSSAALAKLNGSPSSPGSLRRSRQSESCLQKSKRDSFVRDFPVQKSTLPKSSSLLQLRAERRGDVSKRRTFDQDDTQGQKQNSSWDPAPVMMKMNKRASTGSFMKPPALSQDSSGRNATWGFASPPSTKGVDAIEKMRQKALLMKAANERRSSLGPKMKNQSEHSTDELSRSSRRRNSSDQERKLSSEIDISQNSRNSKSSNNSNGYAQFDFGQVAYRESNVCLSDLVDDMNSKESTRSIQKADDSPKLTDDSPGKKGLRKYLKKQLTKRAVGKEKQASESLNDKYATLLDDSSQVMGQ